MLNLIKSIKSIPLKILIIFFVHFIIIFLFSIINHFYLSPDDFNGGNTITCYNDTLYHTIITHASIGYGDISPKTNQARLVASIHVIIVFMLIVTLQP